MLRVAVVVVAVPVNADGSIFRAGSDEFTPRIDGHAGQRGTPVEVVKAVSFVGQI